LARNVVHQVKTAMKRIAIKIVIVISVLLVASLTRMSRETFDLPIGIAAPLGEEGRLIQFLERRQSFVLPVSSLVIHLLKVRV